MKGKFSHAGKMPPWPASSKKSGSVFHCLAVLKKAIHKAMSNSTTPIPLAYHFKPQREIQIAGSKVAIIVLTAMFNSTFQGSREVCIFKDGVHTMVTLKVIRNVWGFYGREIHLGFNQRGLLNGPMRLHRTC